MHGVYANIKEDLPMRTLEYSEIASVGLNPDDFERVFAYDESNSILQYLKGYKTGFISNGKVITSPIYTQAMRLINGKYILANVFDNRKYYNTGVLIDAKTGETLISNFSAYFIKDDLLAYRVNGATCEEHRWGIYDIANHKRLGNPIFSYPYIHKAVDRLLGMRKVVKENRK